MSNKINEFKRKIRCFGIKYFCPICKAMLAEMLPMGIDSIVQKEKEIIGAGRRKALCPVCYSTDRERLLYLFLRNKTDLFKKEIKLLHVAPEKGLLRIFERKKNIACLTADLFEEDVMVKMDITDIQYPDDSFDAVICNHVFEHVVDDRKAMNEIYRVLNPLGWAILQVPISVRLEETYENSSVINPCDRKKVFGQADHVRIYGKDYEDKIRSVGFYLEIFSWSSHLNKFGGKGNRFALNKEENIYFATKRKRTF